MLTLPIKGRKTTWKFWREFLFLIAVYSRYVQRHSFDFPDVKQKLTEVSLDGGKVRIRGPKGEKCYYKEYKTARLQGIYYGAFFQDNLSLINWVNSQTLANPLYCLGDGHDGIWNIFAEISDPGLRVEILDWYHLKENLYKIETDSKLLKKLETLLGARIGRGNSYSVKWSQGIGRREIHQTPNKTSSKVD